MEFNIELYEMRKDCVEMSVELEEDDFLEVDVIDVGQHVEQKTVNLLDVGLERGGKFNT